MRMQQLKEWLDYLVHCRQDMALLYGRLQQQADASRVKLLLGYLQKQQVHIAQAMEDYIDQAQPGSLDVWYKDVEFEDFLHRCQALMLPANMNSEDVLALHLDLENRLIALLEMLAQKSAHSDTCSMLEDLVRVERVQQQRLVHSAQRMEDI
ncbi:MULTISPECIES: hypothetical protein [Shewanella]|uniref:Uncharacterized protein n=2 Tax=Shewanella TaxID=22 RepID=A0A974XP34_9GAMM|nr:MULTISPECIES: hypothetical protein [Shewanella]QSX31941.1 hypothetical protein JYB88_14930 [Shewanella cyperi]QSX39153.1 hypothetical protein JYB85_15390 [Shewanella sedimentimangrovi]QSX42705.1 hypothetical protein JYB84_14980 [Shewanella cyperi]